MDSDPGMERLALIMVDRDRDVHVLHYLFSVQIEPHSKEHHLLYLRGELPLKGIPLIADIPVASLTVRRSVSSVPRE